MSEWVMKYNESDEPCRVKSVQYSVDALAEAVESAKKRLTDAARRTKHFTEVVANYGSQLHNAITEEKHIKDELHRLETASDLEFRP